MKCRHCGSELKSLFLDLGSMPPSNAYLSADQLDKPEPAYPLRIFVCESCWLVQTEDFSRCDELFTSDYAYFSSVSDSWLKHAADYCRMIGKRLGLGTESRVVEVASNDGYLLRNFVAAGIPCLGIEPTDSTAAASEALGVPVLRRFFGEQLADELVSDGYKADLIVGNNVFAHVPDINDFALGLVRLLQPEGTITLEFPHLKNLIEFTQFDTIYHEHYSYLSLHAVQSVLQLAGLRLYDVEKLPTHGGSLRVYAAHTGSAHALAEAVNSVLQEERQAGLLDIETYRAMQSRVERIREELLAFLHEQKRAGKMVAAYGAAAKGNTLLNFAGVTPDLLPFVCDAAPSKQDKFMPGSHIPILHPDHIAEVKPDYLLILPWNICEEIIERQQQIRGWGGCFVVGVPKLEIIG
ncbi:Methyltransferase domain-containing protein [Mariprofundus ferrinatatus]|uniref:Methyltransferase domain-containing protein n=1 Tax=Mariprofundus ferrinatatus TaxID=1921087 RepID=A0A2K8LDJ0_9PROT|nr:class I SAM-dependent methyltransferase [Mariprofundus ferrinatatus]ATX82974.1 Methyltransferase domain-containing protein [Mariprofundus ferrinatatus]